MPQGTALCGVAPPCRLGQAYGAESPRGTGTDRGWHQAGARERAGDDPVLAPGVELERHCVGSRDVGEGQGLGGGTDPEICLSFEPAAGSSGGRAMLGLMQQHPLLISSLIEHAAKAHPHGEIVSRTVEGPLHRCTYVDIARRAGQVANLLASLGVVPGERVGSLAWNGYRHLELFFGTSGMGAVLHTINPRLFPEQLEYIINHAEDQYLCFDVCFAPLVEKLAPKLRSVKSFIAMTDRDHMPSEAIPRLQCYEELLAQQDPLHRWPQFDENSASSLCYTSGTTGNPKGVLYSHRSTLLHSLAACAADAFGLVARDSILTVGPLFPARPPCAPDALGFGARYSILPVVPLSPPNGWTLPFSAAMCGAKLVLPG